MSLKSLFLRRLASIVYDSLVVVAILMVLTGSVMAARAGRPYDPRSIEFRGLLLIGWWAYFAWSWTHGGQTLGMRAWRLELVARKGTTISLARATLRFLGAWLSALAFGLGFLWCLVDTDGLAWHDRLSGTALSLRPKSAQPGHREGGQKQ